MSETGVLGATLGLIDDHCARPDFNSLLSAMKTKARGSILVRKHYVRSVCVSVYLLHLRNRRPVSTRRWRRP